MNILPNNNIEVEDHNHKSYMFYLKDIIGIMHNTNNIYINYCLVYETFLNESYINISQKDAMQITSLMKNTQPSRIQSTNIKKITCHSDPWIKLI